MRDLVSRVIHWLTPWYSEADAERREQATEAARQRSIRARIGAEREIGPERYETARRNYRRRLVGR